MSHTVAEDPAGEKEMIILWAGLLSIYPLPTEEFRSLIKLAGGLGFEPRLVDPESTVLPLDDPPACRL